MLTQNFSLLLKAGGVSRSSNVPQVSKPAFLVAVSATDVSATTGQKINHRAHREFSTEDSLAFRGPQLPSNPLFKSSRTFHALSVPSVVLLLLLLLSPSPSAYGITWNMPDVPYAYGSHRFQYWTSLPDSVKVSGTSGKGSSLDLRIGFIPASSYESPIGYGFEFPLFDSRLVWLDDKNVEMHLPDGNTQGLDYNERTRILRSCGWKGQFDTRKNQVTLKSSSNWSCTFVANRLTSIRTPEGVSLNITRKPGGALQLSRGSTPLVTLTPDFDPKTAHKIYHLKYGSKTATLHMGQRPIVSTKKSDNGKIVMVPALTGIQFSKNHELLFDFQLNEVTINRDKRRWDDEYRLTLWDGIEYSYSTIAGIFCVKQVHQNGMLNLHGRKDYKVVNMGTEGQLRLCEYLPPAKGTQWDDFKLEKISKIHPDGKLELVKQVWFDAKRNPIKAAIYENGTVTTLHQKGNKRSAIDANGGLLWSQEQDSLGRIISFQNQNFLYTIQYANDGFVTIERISANGTKTIRVPQSSLAQLFP